MIHKKIFSIKTLFCLLFISLVLNEPVFASQITVWKPLAKGLEYTVITPMSRQPQHRIHAFRIDLKYYQLELEMAHIYQDRALFADNIHTEKKAVLAINGGFFSKKLAPLGLRINHGEALSPIKRTRWWAILMIKNHHANIFSRSAYRYSKNIDFAIQSGPRLIINGHIPQLRPGKDQRSAIGITKDGFVILAITDDLLLTTTQMAHFLQAPLSQGGLACYNALNLDGGNSSQFFAKIGNFSLYVRSFRPVSDLIVVKRR